MKRSSFIQGARGVSCRSPDDATCCVDIHGEGFHRDVRGETVLFLDCSGKALLAAQRKLVLLIGHDRGVEECNFAIESGWGSSDS